MKSINRLSEDLKGKEIDNDEKMDTEYFNNQFFPNQPKEPFNKKQFEGQNSMQFNLNKNQIYYSNNDQQRNNPLNFSGISFNQDTKSLPMQRVPNLEKDFSPLPPNIMDQNTFSRDHLLFYFRDQKSTIFLQRIIMGANKEMIEHILKELKGIFRRIIKDKNGNYFCSDLFKVCELNHRIQILGELSPFLSEDCTNNFATHAIQALIDRSSTEEEYILILFSFNEYNKFLFAALDPNGAYTMRKIIERIPERFRMQFNIIFTSFIGFISKKKFGIVVVKTFISNTKSDDITALILKLVKENFMDFAVDQYANYLIQFLFEKWKETPEGKVIKDLIKENFLAMCEKKYSSFICELFVKNMTSDEKNELIKDIDANEVNNSTNPHYIKIMKLLGIYTNQNNNNNNNFELAKNFNNNFIPNNNFPQNFMSRFNFANNNNFLNNNNINNNNNNFIKNNMFNNNIINNNYNFKPHIKNK